MRQEFARSLRNNRKLSILMIDIDHFKLFNDNLGHDAGDEVLNHLGAFLRNEVRVSDVACRYGGEEFIVLFTETSAEIAFQRAEQMRKGIKAIRVKLGDKLLPEITISGGIAEFPNHAQSIESLIKAADTALYKAKSLGRDRLCLADIIEPSFLHQQGSVCQNRRSFLRELSGS